VIRHLIERVRHPRRRYFAHTDMAEGYVVRGYVEGRVVHLTSMSRVR
jgi:hypothetical protein